jgi:hypothetical protein
MESIVGYTGEKKLGIMDYLDHDPKASRKGLIGFQIHDGSVMKVEYRNIRILTLEP